MSKKLFALLLAALMVCGAALALADGIAVTDMHGREITLDAPATRIVALTPSDCEILCAIGGGDALVGRGKYCDYPESVTELPVVQSGAETNIEEILALEPQIVLMSDMSQTEEQAKLLEQNGLRHIRFHDLRHSCASLLLANDVPLKQIQEWLGHSDIGTTANIYSHLDYKSKITSANVMDNLLTLPDTRQNGWHT